MVTMPMQPIRSPGGVNVRGKAMSASVEPELSLTSSKPAPSAGRSGMLGLCRFGTIGFAAVVLAFALGYVAPEAALAVQSKDYAQPAQSKDRAAQAAEDRRVPPAQSKSRRAKPVQTESKDRRVPPAQSQSRHPQPV